MRIYASHNPIFAADDDELEGEVVIDQPNPDDDEALADQVDEVADQVDDIQEDVEEVTEDEIDIDTDNNIENHYIAECDACHGIFISAMIESDQEVDHISGICPLCQKDSDQKLRWVVKAIGD